MSEKLKPCPFCGSHDLFFAMEVITCGGCSTEGPWKDGDRKRAEDAWNRRANEEVVLGDYVIPNIVWADSECDVVYADAGAPKSVKIGN